MRVHRKAKRLPVRGGNRLRLKIHRHAGIGPFARIGHQHIHLLLRQDDRQNPVLEAVVKEDIGKRGRDHTANAEIKKRPRRMLTRRSAAEIVARHQNLRTAIGGLVQHEIGNLIALAVKAHLVKQVLSQARSLNRLQELLGNDHVRVDVDQGHRCGNAGQFGEFFHDLILTPSRPSSRAHRSDDR